LAHALRGIKDRGMDIHESERGRKCQFIREYMRPYHLDFDLPDIQICLSKGVFPPKLDSFLVAKELLQIVDKNQSVLDIGTGSGIIAILAGKMGASVLATDIHPLSIKCAKYNAQLNDVELSFRESFLFESIKNT
jgi:methylase of polypeptide subunit release factors